MSMELLRLRDLVVGFGLLPLLVFLAFLASGVALGCLLRHPGSPGRREWCWALLRVQFLLGHLWLLCTLCQSYACGGGFLGLVFLASYVLTWLVYSSAYLLFAVPLVAWRLREPPRVSALTSASVIASVLQVVFMCLGLLLVLCPWGGVILAPRAARDSHLCRNGEGTAWRRDVGLVALRSLVRPRLGRGLGTCCGSENGASGDGYGTVACASLCGPAIGCLVAHYGIVLPLQRPPAFHVPGDHHHVLHGNWYGCLLCDHARSGAVAPW